MHTSLGAGISLALLLLAFALEAPFVNGEAERNENLETSLETGLTILNLAENRSSVQFQLDCADCARLSEAGLIFDLAVRPSAGLCDVSSVYINGQALFDHALESNGLPRHLHGSLNVSHSTDNGTYIAASWYLACILGGGTPTFNHVIVNVDEFDGKPVGNVAFDAQIIQGAEPKIYQITSRRSGKTTSDNAGISLPKGSPEDGQIHPPAPPKLIDELDERRAIKHSIKELEREIKEKKRRFKEKKRHIKNLLRTEYQKLMNEIKNCNGVGCVLEEVLPKARSMVQIVWQYSHHQHKKHGKHDKHHKVLHVGQLPGSQARPWYPPRPLLEDAIQDNSSPAIGRELTSHHHRHHKHHGPLILRTLSSIFLLLLIAVFVRRHRCKRHRPESRRCSTRACQIIASAYGPCRPSFSRQIYRWGRLPRNYNEKRAPIPKLEEILENAMDSLSDISCAEEGLVKTSDLSTKTPISAATELPSQALSELVEPPQYEMYDGSEVKGLGVNGLRYTPSGQNLAPAIGLPCDPLRLEIPKDEKDNI